MAVAEQTPPAVDRPRPTTAPPRTGWRKHWHLYAAISPFYLLFLAFGLIPVGFSLYLSLHRWDGHDLVTHYERVSDWNVIAHYTGNLQAMIQDMFAERE